MHLTFTRLSDPTPELAEAFDRWENDPSLIPLCRPNRSEDDLARRQTFTLQDLMERLERHHIYLIYLGAQLIGSMDYLVDFDHLFKKEPGTAWVGISIGEKSGRGRGIGYQAMQYLEEQIRSRGLKRIELGVFEFNAQAIKLYQKAGFTEIGRIEDFAYWRGRLWSDIRMEKYI